MPRPSNDSAVTLSILDRLTDLDPRNRSAEAPIGRNESVRRLKASVRRDLEWLLNTRRTADRIDDSLTETLRSVYVFGIPDFSNYSIATARDQGKLIRTLKSSLELFEPRLANVRLTLVDATVQGTRSIRFRLEGMLRMDPSPEHVSFDTVLQLTTGDFQVRGDSDA